MGQYERVLAAVPSISSPGLLGEDGAEFLAALETELGRQPDPNELSVTLGLISESKREQEVRWTQELRSAHLASGISELVGKLDGLVALLERRPSGRPTEPHWTQAVAQAKARRSSDIVQSARATAVGALTAARALQSDHAVLETAIHGRQARSQGEIEAKLVRRLRDALGISQGAALRIAGAIDGADAVRDRMKFFNRSTKGNKQGSKPR